MIDATESPIEKPKKSKGITNSGKRKRHTFKIQLIVDKKSRRVISTSFCKGKGHDFRLYKESNTPIHPKTKVITDTGYQGLQKLHANTVMPIKRKKNQNLSREEKRQNRAISSQRVEDENVIGLLKRFKIISDRYRNRRKRFGLRFNLIAGIYNWEISN